MYHSQRSYWDCFWYCSGPEQRRFGPVVEHFLFQSRNMLSIFSVLSDTVTTISLSAPPYHRAHTTLSRHQSHNVTDDAGQTRLLMLWISHWLRVRCCSTAFAVNITQPLSGADGPSESEYDIMHECTSHTCTARRHRPHSRTHIDQHGARCWTDNADRQ